MPNRIIKESITTSETLDILTAEEERFFYRLIVKCDDYGLMDARPKVLRAACFALKVDEITDDMVATWLNRLAEVGLIELYENDGRPYLHMITWEDHQQIRAKRAKYPMPDENGCKPLLAIDINGNHVQAEASKCPRNPIQSESNPNPIRRRTAPPAESFGPDSQEYQLAELLRDCMLARDPNTKTPDNLQGWAKHADLLLRVDERPLSEVRELIAWCQQDSFWSANVLSMAAFRKQYDRLKRKAEQTRAPTRTYAGTLGTSDERMRAYEGVVQRG